MLPRTRFPINFPLKEVHLANRPIEVARLWHVKCGWRPQCTCGKEGESSMHSAPHSSKTISNLLSREKYSPAKGEEGGDMARLRGGMVRRLARATAISKADTLLDAILRRRVRLTMGEDLNRINRSEVDVTVHDILYVIGGRRRRASSCCSWPGRLGASGASGQGAQLCAGGVRRHAPWEHAAKEPHSRVVRAHCHCPAKVDGDARAWSMVTPHRPKLPVHERLAFEAATPACSAAVGAMHHLDPRVARQWHLGRETAEPHRVHWTCPYVLQEIKRLMRRFCLPLAHAHLR